MMSFKSLLSLAVFALRATHAAAQTSNNETEQLAALYEAAKAEGGQLDLLFGGDETNQWDPCKLTFCHLNVLIIIDHPGTSRRLYLPIPISRHQCDVGGRPFQSEFLPDCVPFSLSKQWPVLRRYCRQELQYNRKSWGRCHLSPDPPRF